MKCEFTTETRRTRRREKYILAFPPCPPCLRGEPEFQSQRILRKAQIFNHFPPNEMFLNNPLSILRRHILIPRPLRIHDRDRPRRADAQAAAFCAIAWPIWPGEV